MNILNQKVNLKADFLEKESTSISDHFSKFFTEEGLRLISTNDRIESFKTLIRESSKLRKSIFTKQEKIDLNNNQINWKVCSKLGIMEGEVAENPELLKKISFTDVLL